jgi:uncharacterized RDD family membrane protein YckC
VPKFQITTPEQVVFHYAVAGVVSRCLAWITDQIIIWAGYIIIILLFASLGNGIALALIVLGIFVLDFSYFICFELYWAGQTPGKRLFQIRVISSRGTRLRFADCLIRNMVRPVDMLPFAMLLGGCVAFIDRSHRRLGDMVADTIVVRDIRRALPQAMANEKLRVNTFQADAALRNRILSRVSPAERDLIMDLTLRRDQMDSAVREELFSGAAAHFRLRLSLPADLDHLSDEQAIVNLALVIQETKFTA